MNRLRTFSLRTAMLLFLLLCVGFGVAAHLYHDVLKRCAVMGWIIEYPESGTWSRNRKAFEWSYAPEGEISEWTKLVRKRIHPEYLRKLETLTLHGDPLAEHPEFDLSLLFGVRKVYVHGELHRDSAIRILAIKGMTELKVEAKKLIGEIPEEHRDLRPAADLESLVWEGAPLPPEFAENLAKCPKLATVTLSAAAADAFAPLCRIENLTDLSIGWSPRGAIATSKLTNEEEHRLFHRGLADLAQRAKLNRLQILGRFPIDPADLAEFCAGSPVRSLTLKWTELNPQCLKELAKLGELVELDLNEPHIEDEHLLWLAESKSLKVIRIAPSAKNTANGVLALAKKMPGCDVRRD